VSGWELFTWINVAILGLGSLVVFVAFLADLPGLLRRSERPEREAPSDEPDAGP
jgi:hypothetical protein